LTAQRIVEGRQRIGIELRSLLLPLRGSGLPSLQRRKDCVALRRRELSLHLADQCLLLRGRQRVEHLDLLLHRQRHLSRYRTEQTSEHEGRYSKDEAKTLSTAKT